MKRGFNNVPETAVEDPKSPVNVFMKILLAATTIARPKSTTINIPPMMRHVVNVDFVGCWAQLEVIRELVTSSKRLLSRAARLEHTRGAELLKTRAFQKLMRAQQHAACPLTVHAPNWPKGLPTELPPTTAIMFAQYLTAKGMAQNTSMNHLTEAQYVDFRAFCEDCKVTSTELLWQSVP